MDNVQDNIKLKSDLRGIEIVLFQLLIIFERALKSDLRGIEMKVEYFGNSPTPQVKIRP